MTRHLILPEKRVQFCGVSVRVRASEQQLRCELVGGVASWLGAGVPFVEKSGVAGGEAGGEEVEVGGGEGGGAEGGRGRGCGGREKDDEEEEARGPFGVGGRVEQAVEDQGAEVAPQVCVQSACCL